MSFHDSALALVRTGQHRADWVRKYENGAVGSFTHAVALQGHAYACELEVWADGYHMRYVS